jgi:hypothetical protein
MAASFRRQGQILVSLAGSRAVAPARGGGVPLTGIVFQMGRPCLDRP